MNDLGRPRKCISCACFGSEFWYGSANVQPNGSSEAHSSLVLGRRGGGGKGPGNEATAHSCKNCTITSQPVSLECTPGLGGNQSGCPHLEQFLLSVGRREPHSLEKGTQCSKVSRRKYS